MSMGIFKIKFSYLYCMPYDSGMDKVEVNDAHDNDDY
jgi:hypothetical protein